MKIYIDSDYKCHASSAEGLRAFEVPFFDGKCKAFIEGYRYVPDGETWTRSDGKEFQGEMTAPYVDYSILETAQRAYERQQLADMRAALELLGVTDNG